MIANHTTVKFRGLVELNSKLFLAIPCILYFNSSHNTSHKYKKHSFKPQRVKTGNMCAVDLLTIVMEVEQVDNANTAMKDSMCFFIRSLD